MLFEMPTRKEKKLNPNKKNITVYQERTSRRNRINKNSHHIARSSFSYDDVPLRGVEGAWNKIISIWKASNEIK
jgi:hypothetical protein